ncbi:MAG: DMT family transporter [Minwuia sp.]|uniref:DMT family transporter n=1 Tax=Minwuia sp. TaxID=2493630 RepID=UPI003A878480
MPTALVVALWMVFSAAGFAAILVIVRELSQDLPVFVLNFWRNIFAVMLFLPWLARNGFGAMRTRRLPLLFLRSVVMVTSSIMLFYSAVLIPIGEATAITFTSPLFTTLLAALLLKEHVGWRRSLALGAGFAGVLIILRPGMEAITPGALLAIGSSILFAFVVIIGKRLSETESPGLVILMLSLINLPISFVPALAVWQFPEGSDWVWLLALGIAATMNMYGIQRAISAGDASLSQVFDFVRLPLAALAAWLVFSEVPDPWTWAGAAVIFAAAVYTTRREARAR